MNNEPPVRPQLHAILAAALQAWIEGAHLGRIEAALVLGVSQATVGQLLKNPGFLSTEQLATMWEHVGNIHMTLEVDPKWSRE